VPLLAAGPAQAAEPSLNATAGVGGVARAGRWLPVAVTITSADAPLGGEVSATWGETTATREVVLAAQSRTRVELYLRAADPRDSIHIALRRTAADPVTRELPVQLLPIDVDAALCIGHGADTSGTTPCAASIEAVDLPRSPRAFDVFDRVVWNGPRAEADAQQRSAIEAWAHTRDLVTSGAMSQAPRPRPVADTPMLPQPTAVTLVAGGLGYIVLLTAAIQASASRGRPILFCGAIVGVSLLGALAATLTGHGGPAAAVLIEHATTAYQLDVHTSLVTSRAQARFPARSRYEIPAAFDGALIVDDYPRRLARANAAGQPTLAGTYALGTSQGFEAEGTLAFTPFSVDRNGDAVRVRNVSGETLRACRLTDGYRSREAGDLPPEGSATLTSGDVRALPTFACHAHRFPIPLEPSGRSLRVSGDTVVSIALGAVEIGL